MNSSQIPAGSLGLAVNVMKASIRGIKTACFRLRLENRRERISIFAHVKVLEKKLDALEADFSGWKAPMVRLLERAERLQEGCLLLAKAIMEMEAREKFMAGKLPPETQMKMVDNRAMQNLVEERSPAEMSNDVRELKSASQFLGREADIKRLFSRWEKIMAQAAT